jgi:hypothetical protein
MNKWLFGTAPDTVVLISRQLGYPTVAWAEYLSGEQRRGQRWVNAGGDLGWVRDYAFQPPPGHYPWGYGVEPDVH